MRATILRTMGGVLAIFQAQLVVRHVRMGALLTFVTIGGMLWVSRPDGRLRYVRFALSP